MLNAIFTDYKHLGLVPIPIVWDTELKQPKYHNNGWADITPETNCLQCDTTHNGLMIRTHGKFKCIDIDLKNTKNKNLYQTLLGIISTQHPDLLAKIFIERTRNGGYHIWLIYHKELPKTSLADSEDGSEVIALYSGGPLVYTYPTPGYSIITGSMDDMQPLTDDEFNFLIETSQYFNEYQPKYDPSLKAVSYPKGHESFCVDFDTKLSDDSWQQILNDVGLQMIPNYKYAKKDKFTAYKRNGSDSQAISAKVYFHTKRVMIFSASLHDFPNWHNKHDYPVWCLPPSFVLFYHNKRDWKTTFEQMQMIADSDGIDLKKPEQYKGEYPMDVFPEAIKQSILEVSQARSICPEFLATSALYTISSLAGTHYTSDFNGDAKNILFCLLIAPVSVGKTPAFKSMCETPLRMIQEAADKHFAIKIKDYDERKAATDKNFTEKRPRRFIPFAVDGTTEGYVALSMDQPNGIGVYHDEAETIFNAGSFKGTNDAISFFTQAFSGGRFTQIRADRDKERIVPNMNINLMMGTQPNRLQNIFTSDRLSSGFASRFLMVESDYIELNTEVDPFAPNKEMCHEWVELLATLYRSGENYNGGEVDKIRIVMDNETKNIYRGYYKQNLQDANKRILSKAEQYIIGTEAKMSAYFPRFVQILAIIHNPLAPHINTQTVNDAYRLYRYYAAQTVKIITNLAAEVETGLPASLEIIYQGLPDSFKKEDAEALCIRLNLPKRKFETAMRRKDFKALFRKAEHGIYTKI